jgi:SNF2 family DNA or RNA helicase
MQWIPHEYQNKAMQLILSKPHCGLFLDPGLGKTVTTLSAFKILKDKKLAKRALVVAPLRVAKYTWGDELSKWDHLSELSFSVVHGAEKEKTRHADADIHVINPEGLIWLLPLLAKEKVFPYDCLIIDESTKFKSWTSRRFKLLKPLLGKFSRRIILTGTPATNGMMDLFAQMFIVDQGLALSAYITHFRAEFFEQKPFDPYGWHLKQNAEQEIYNRIQHKVMRMDAADYLDIPELVEQDIWIDLPDSARREYRMMENTLQLQIASGQITAANAAVAIGKARQIASGFIYDDAKQPTWLHDAKFEALDDLLEQLEGKPVLLLYNFTATASRLAEKYKCPVFGGDANEAQRQVLNDWNEGKIPLLAGHPASMGHGLNMQAGGCHIIWFDHTYDLEHYLQANARLHRQGQKSVVFVHRLLARGTVEKAIIAKLAAKDKTQSGLLEALREYWASP